MSIRFASSQYNTMRPLAFQGILATDCHAQLQALLKQYDKFLSKHGMPNAVHFFAEPVLDRHRGIIDWYALGDTKPVPLKSLPPAEQDAIQKKLQTYSQAIAQLLQQLQQNSLQEEQMPRAMLRLALRHPSPDDIWVQDNQPFVINWGFNPGAQDAQPEDIIRLGVIAPPPKPVPKSAIPTPPPAAAAVPAAAAIPPEMPPSAVPIPEPSPAPQATPQAAFFPGCLSWLLPLFLLLLCLWLLLTALNLLPSPLPSGCFYKDVTGARTEELRKKDLDSTYNALLAQLQQRAAQCAPTPVKKPFTEQEPVLPTYKEPPQTEQRADSGMPFFGAQAQPNYTPRKGDVMKIPEQAVKEKDLSFLDGCWRSVTGLQNTHGKSIVAKYCFDKNGKGKRFVYEEDGQTCSGPATAKIKGNSLSIIVDYATCSRGSSYTKQTITCQGQGDSTHCRGVEKYPGKRKQHSWDAGFIRE